MDPRGAGRRPTNELERNGLAWQFVLCPAAAEGGGSVRQSPPDRGGGGCAELDPEAAAERSRVEAGRRARRQVRLYCAANRLDHLGTLTYRPPGCYEP